MPRRRLAFLVLVMGTFLLSALPMPSTQAAHGNPGFDTCDLSGWNLWEMPSPPMTPSMSGSAGGLQWTRSVAPAYAQAGPCGLKLRCEANQNYCHPGVQRTVTPSSVFGMWIRLVENTPDGYGYDLYVRVRDALGAVYWSFDPSWPSAYCDSAGNPSIPEMRCESYPANTWQFVCLDVPGRYQQVHQRPVGGSYEILLLTDAHTTAAEVWIDSTTHSCSGGGGGCEPQCPPPDPPAPCQAGNATYPLGSYAFVGGGWGNAASGSFSTVGGGYGNHASGLLGTIPGGGCNRASGHASVAGGGESNDAAGKHTTVAGGMRNVAAGKNATISGGASNDARADHSTIPGGKDARTRTYGQLAYASGAWASQGDAQSSRYVLRGVTGSITTAVALTTDGTGASIQVPTGASFAFRALVVARSPSGESAGWELTGVVENVGGSVNLLGGSVAATSIGADPLTATWSVSASAGTGVLRFSAMGAPGARFVATVDTAEVLVP